MQDDAVSQFPNILYFVTQKAFTEIIDKTFMKVELESYFLLTIYINIILQGGS